MTITPRRLQVCGGKNDSTLMLHSAIRKLFSAGWAVNFKELHLGNMLGKGDFGDVYEGTFRGQKVAVKSVKDKSKAAQAFLAEAYIMT